MRWRGLISTRKLAKLPKWGCELDYTKLYQAYSTKARNPAVDPKTMFKILTYAYSQNIYSSRKIERACCRDINFMWLLTGQKAPDHSTIAKFRTGFIDRTKLEACANKYTFVWKKSVNKWEEKMFSKVELLISLFNQESPFWGSARISKH